MYEPELNNIYDSSGAGEVEGDDDGDEMREYFYKVFSPKNLSFDPRVYPVSSRVSDTIADVSAADINFINVLNQACLFYYGDGSFNGSDANATRFWNDSDYFGSPLSYYNCSSVLQGNSTSGSSEPDKSLDLWQVVLFGTLAGCTSLVTVVGNLIVLLSFIIERTIRQPTNYFIASLAVSDLILGSISMPFYTLYLLAGQKWNLGPNLCDLWLSIDYTVCLASIYTVFCITIDRFCSVTIPAKYRDWRTERKVLVMIAVTWIIPILVFFISIFGWQYFVGERTVEEGKCYVQYMDNPVFNCLLQVGYFWITLVIMFILYTGIYQVALRMAAKSEQKYKKMNSLVSATGQTMTTIGMNIGHKVAVNPTPARPTPLKANANHARGSILLTAASVTSSSTTDDKKPSPEVLHSPPVAISRCHLGASLTATSAPATASTIVGTAGTTPAADALAKNAMPSLLPVADASSSERILTSCKEVDCCPTLNNCAPVSVTSICSRRSSYNRPINSDSLIVNSAPRSLSLPATNFNNTCNYESVIKNNATNHNNNNNNNNNNNTFDNDDNNKRVNNVIVCSVVDIGNCKEIEANANCAHPTTPTHDDDDDDVHTIQRDCSGLAAVERCSYAPVKALNALDSEMHNAISFSLNNSKSFAGGHTQSDTRRELSDDDEDVFQQEPDTSRLITDKSAAVVASCAGSKTATPAPDYSAQEVVATAAASSIIPAVSSDCRGNDKDEDPFSFPSPQSYRKATGKTKNDAEAAVPSKVNNIASMNRTVSSPDHCAPLLQQSSQAHKEQRSIKESTGSRGQGQKYSKHSKGTEQPKHRFFLNFRNREYFRQKQRHLRSSPSAYAQQQQNQQPSNQKSKFSILKRYLSESDTTRQSSIRSTISAKLHRFGSQNSKNSMPTQRADHQHLKGAKSLKSMKSSCFGRNKQFTNSSSVATNHGHAKPPGRVSKASKSENRARKALRTITIILGAFVICWTPWHVLSLILGFYGDHMPAVFSGLLYDISYWLCYLNSPINPFCYALANQQFKKAFSRILKLNWHRT